MAFTHLHRDLLARQPATTLISMIAHTHRNAGERLCVCHVKCVQGVPGLALTTEQGSVFVQGSHLAFFLYIGTLCVAEPV